MHDISDDSAPFRWNRMRYIDARNTIASLRVIVNSNAVWFEFPMGVARSIELLGMTICSLDFDPWTEQGVMWHSWSPSRPLRSLDVEQAKKDETAYRRDDALRRALATSPKRHRTDARHA